MTNSRNQYTKFVRLVEQIDCIGRATSPDMNGVQQLMEKIVLFLADLAEAIMAQAQQLKERQCMALHCNEYRLDDKLRLHFFKDQFLFLLKWRDDFENLVFQYNDRCQVNLSSREMLYVVRLLRDAGVLEQKELKYTFHFLSRHFYTAQQGALSTESLRKKYSQLDKRLMHNITKLLARLSELNKAYLLAAKAGSI